MLRLGILRNERSLARNVLQVTQLFTPNIIYDTRAVMAMITDHGWGYMTNKRGTSHEVTGCLNKKPKGGHHIVDFSSLLLMDDTTKGFNDTAT